MNHRRFHARAAIFAFAASVVGCQDEREPVSPAASASSPAPEAAPGASAASIIRPEVAPVAAEPAPPPPLNATVGFPDGGQTLGDEAELALREVLESDQLAEGWPIIVRGHSDSVGSDEANLRISLARAESVAEWLVKHEVDEERITVIALGEQNPSAPNALPDGTPNEAGRARNRRVEISIAPESEASDPEARGESPDGAAPDTA